MAWDLLDRIGGSVRKEGKGMLPVWRPSRRRALGAAAMGIASLLGCAIDRATAADVTPINFVEAVHNLGYINL
jgi:hypothetical protein